MKKIIVFLTLILVISCNSEKRSSFPKEALAEVFFTTDNKEITFETILNKHKGKKIIIETCASWCEECILGLPAMRKLKENNPNVVFVFLSVDKTKEKWKWGMEKFFNIKGEYYFLSTALKGGFAKSLGIDDVPNYIVVNEKGIISLANLSESNDPRISAALKEK